MLKNMTASRNPMGEKKKMGGSPESGLPPWVINELVELSLLI